MIDLGLCLDEQGCDGQGCRYTRATCPRAKIERTIIAGLPQTVLAKGWVLSTFQSRAMHADRRDLWSELAVRCHVSRPFAKQAAYEAMWGLGDPWLRHIIIAEMDDMLR